jgi:uncharacterized membrane protein YhfC
MLVWFAVLIALVPSFAYFVYVARTRKSMWLAFAIGAIGWTIALYARLPISNAIKPIIGSSDIVYLGLTISALFAGIFEEGIRYGLMRSIKYLRIDWRHVLAFGLGWGFFEAVLIYAVNLLVATYTLGGDVPFLRLLAGATERNSAIILHVGLTFIIYKAVVSRKLVWFAGAIALHAAVDFFGVLLFYELKLSTWPFEVTVLAVFILITTLAYKIVKKEFKPTEAPPETISRVEG